MKNKEHLINTQDFSDLLAFIKRIAKENKSNRLLIYFNEYLETQKESKLKECVELSRMLSDTAQKTELKYILELCKIEF